MAHSKREVRDDEIKLLKSTVVDDGEGRLGLFLFLTRYKDHKSIHKGFYLKWETPEVWKKIISEIETEEQPADYFRTSFIGIHNPDCIIHRGDNYFTVVDGVKWLKRNLFEKAQTLRSFLIGSLSTNIEVPYPQAFKGQNFLELPKGLWFFENMNKTGE